AAVSRENAIGAGTIGSGATTRKSRQILRQLMPILPARLLRSSPLTGPPQVDARARDEVPKEANRFRLNRNSAKASSKSRARVLGSCGMRNVTSCKRRRIFL